MPVAVHKVRTVQLPPVAHRGLEGQQGGEAMQSHTSEHAYPIACSSWKISMPISPPTYTCLSNVFHTSSHT